MFSLSVLSPHILTLEYIKQYVTQPAEETVIYIYRGDKVFKKRLLNI